MNRMVMPSMSLPGMSLPGMSSAFPMSASGFGGGMPMSGFGAMNFGGISGAQLHGMGVSSSTLMLMAQISMMMAQVLSGLSQFIQQLLAAQAQRQQQGGQSNFAGPGSFSGSPTGGNNTDGTTNGNNNGNNTQVNGSSQLNDSVPANVRRWEPILQRAAAKYGVPVNMLAAVMTQESGGNPRAGSSAGAKGLMQFMDGTFASVAQKHGIQGSIWDPEANIMASAAHLSDLYKQYGNWESVLAAYNAGPGNVHRWRSIGETARYVPNVLRMANQYA